MTIQIPKPLVLLGAAFGVFVSYYVVRHELPALYRYVVKFESM
jgi:hypothetical protein